MKKAIAALCLAAMMISSCASAGQGKTAEGAVPLEKVKAELEGFSYSKYPNVSFECDVPSIDTDELYIITMRDTLEAGKAEREDEMKMASALADIFDIPEDEADKYTSKPDSFNGEAAVEIGQKCVGYVRHGIPSFVIYNYDNIALLPDRNMNYETCTNYTVKNYPKDEFDMADGGKLTVDKAIEQGERIVDSLLKNGLFDKEAQAPRLERISIKPTANGNVITLHYNDVRYGLEIDDSGMFDAESDDPQLRNPFFFIDFAGNNKPLQIKNLYDDGMLSKEPVSEILPLSKAQEYLSRGLAPHIDAHVSETALRYVCIQQKDIKNRVYRPMWCFLLQEYPDGADLKRPFKRRTALVDAIDGTVWYYDPDAYQLYKTELE